MSRTCSRGHEGAARYSNGACKVCQVAHNRSHNRKRYERAARDRQFCQGDFINAVRDVLGLDPIPYSRTGAP